MNPRNNPIWENVRRYGSAFFLWLALGLITGLLCGNVGALFAHTITWVTNLRSQQSWLLYLLPVLGLISAGLYRLLRISDVGTNQVLESVRSRNKISWKLAPAVFAGSALSHLGGASAGREGAALQLGGSITSFLSCLFRLDEKHRHILTLCGMAAVFSSIFGTPVGAAVFALEVVSVGSLNVAAFFPVFIASLTAYSVAQAWGVPAEAFHMAYVPELAMSPLWRIIVIAVVCAVIAVIFCYSLHFTEHLFRRFFKNDFLRIFVGGALIVGLTLLLDTTDYNGGGFPVLERIFEHGEVRWEAFILKILFTAITVAAGFKGGEIVPTFFIGGTSGAALALLLGLDPALGAAIGMVALFCGVTNCPLATVFLAVELFGADGMIFFALASVTSFLMSGHASLYAQQKIRFSKLDHRQLEKEAEH